MKQYLYITISEQTAHDYGFDQYRLQTSDGGYIINESDLLTVGNAGDTLDQKVSAIGGTLLTNMEAKIELQNHNSNE